MNNKIIYTTDPYKMDMIENINVSALNKKNADFIEAVIRLL